MARDGPGTLLGSLVRLSAVHELSSVFAYELFSKALKRTSMRSISQPWQGRCVQISPPPEGRKGRAGSEEGFKDASECSTQLNSAISDGGPPRSTR